MSGDERPDAQPQTWWVAIGEDCIHLVRSDGTCTIDVPIDPNAPGTLVVLDAEDDQ